MGFAGAVRSLAGVLASVMVLAGCSASGSPSSPTSSTAPSTAAATAPAVVPGWGARVATTSADVAGFSLVEHRLNPGMTGRSPDRQRVATSARPAGVTAPPPGRGRQRYLAQKLSWSPCGGLVCASVLVPMDWDHPDGPAITLRLNERPAPAARTGTVFVNPGGPGASGLDYVARFTASQLAHDDVIGWDPRGTGGSTPVQCGGTPAEDKYLAIGRGNYATRDWSGVLRIDRAIARRCRQLSGDLLDHLGTLDTARDLDYLRYLAGQPRLDYLGISYGTYLGAVYAELYPHRVGRMVLDSVVANGSRLASVSTGRDDVLASYADWCVHTRCGLGTTRNQVIGVITRLLTTLQAKPLHVGDRVLTAPLAVNGIDHFLYAGSGQWPSLTGAVSFAQAGEGTELLVAADLILGRNDATNQYSEAFGAGLAVSANDVGDDGIGYLNQLAHSQPAGPIDRFRGIDVLLEVWPARPEPALALHAAGAPPILLVAATQDPATPHAGAVWMSHQLRSARLLTWNGDGHGVWQIGNTCARSAEDTYLTTGQLPTRATC